MMPEYRAERRVRELATAAARVLSAMPADDDAAPLHAFVQAHPDPATWTNAELRQALIRLIRIELRRRGMGVE